MKSKRGDAKLEAHRPRKSDRPRHRALGGSGQRAIKRYSSYLQYPSWRADLGGGVRCPPITSTLNGPPGLNEPARYSLWCFG